MLCEGSMTLADQQDFFVYMLACLGVTGVCIAVARTTECVTLPRRDLNQHVSKMIGPNEGH